MVLFRVHFVPFVPFLPAHVFCKILKTLLLIGCSDDLTLWLALSGLRKNPFFALYYRKLL